MFKLKDNFGLGVATASAQIEGGDVNNNWNDWFKQGKIKDGSDPAISTMHYELWKEDAKLLKDLGIKYNRMSIEWSRIQPSENVFDKEVINHYIEEITLLQKYNIKCMVTLHHFSNPMWFEKKGGFLHFKNNIYFLNFVEYVVKSFGDLVDEYITINEPNVYAVMGYLMGVFPPGQRKITYAKRVMTNLVSAHIDSYKLIHKIKNNVKVSFANHLIVFIPKKNNILNKISTSIFIKLFQNDISKAMYLGKFSIFIRNIGKHKKGQYVDYIALNYYTRSEISGFKRVTKEKSFVNDIDWEIYPKGLVECAGYLYTLLEVPIYITENGTCDRNDCFRSRYIYEHLLEISQSELPIERYYHWCFVDNFEWAEGMSAKFGIVEVDVTTQKRTIKKSGEFYASIIKDNGVTEENFEKNIKDIVYNVKD